MFLNNAADKLVFKFLNKISHGYLELTTHDGKVLKFGNQNEKLHANILIKKPDFNYNLISCLLYTSPSPRDATLSRMPSSA